MRGVCDNCTDGSNMDVRALDILTEDSHERQANLNWHASCI